MRTVGLRYAWRRRAGAVRARRSRRRGHTWTDRDQLTEPCGFLSPTRTVSGLSLRLHLLLLLVVLRLLVLRLRRVLGRLGLVLRLGRVLGLRLGSGGVLRAVVERGTLLLG